MNGQKSTTFSYFPGCSLLTTNRSYDISARAVAEAIGLELIELDDWNCCGATAYMAINEKRSFVLSARNLAIAEKDGRELVTICNGCYVVLRKTNKYMAENEQLRAEIRAALAAGDMDYGGTVRVRHLLDVVVNDLGEKAIREEVTRPLSGIKVAPYYGCQIGRPFSEIDDAEFPMMLDHLIEWVGADVAPFAMKSKCCGGTMTTTQPEMGMQLTGKILRNAVDAGADCVITACPLCQMNLEAYQNAITEAMGAECHIPVLYFTQLLGVALGLSPEALALSDSLTPVEAVFAEEV